MIFSCPTKALSGRRSPLQELEVPVPSSGEYLPNVKTITRARQNYSTSFSFAKPPETIQKLASFDSHCAVHPTVLHFTTMH